MDMGEMIRLGIFVSLFAILAGFELSKPRRPLTGSKAIRWFSNISMVLLNTALVPLMVPIAAMAMAKVAHDNGWGLFNYYSLPYPIAFACSVVILDFVIYMQHIMFHHVPILWRLHRVHHSDIDLDVTSGTRFHIIEIIISMGIKVCAIVLLGAPVLAVLVFEVILNTTAMFNHSNIRLPLPIDRVLRLFLVTPDMHRVHHSVIDEELNTNFGFSLPWWDYLCGTYRAQPVEGHQGMTIGIYKFRNNKDQYLHRLLMQPFLDAGVDDIEGAPDAQESVAMTQRDSASARR